VLVVISLVFAGCAAPAPEEEVTPPPAEEVKPPPTEEVKPPPAEEDALAVAITALKPTKLKYASCFGTPEIAVTSSGASKLWMDEITKRTNGKITFEEIYGAALGAPAEYIDLLKSGAVDVICQHDWYNTKRLTLSDFDYAIPFGPLDPLISAKAKMQVVKEFPEFEEEMTGENIKQLFYSTTGPYDFLSKEPLLTVEDFEGKKISLIGRYMGQILEPTKAVPVVRIGHERYEMLQTGLLDGDTLPLDLFYQFKIQEQAPNFIGGTGWFNPGGGYSTQMNLDLFNSFAPEIQQLFMEVAEETSLKIAGEVYSTFQDKVYAEWAEQGVEFFIFPTAERNKWAAATPDIPARWADEVEEAGLPGYEIMNRFQDLCEEMGYEWPVRWAVQ